MRTRSRTRRRLAATISITSTIVAAWLAGGPASNAEPGGAETVRGAGPGSGPDAGADPDAGERDARDVMTPARASALLRRPSGSLSLGGTSRGQLLNGVELPHEGPGYSVIPRMRSRDTNWGTEELVGLIQRATARVARIYPGAVVGVGNLGAEDGAKIRWSVSHQAGRDGDLSFYATDARGEPVTHLPMVRYDARGFARGGRLRFDVDRNLALVVAMLEDPVASVQYIFVADWLKQMMLDEARRKGLSEPLMEKLEATLHQPSDSNPHADHFHVRIYCPIEDRLEGCWNWGPERPWADLGDEAFERRVDRLVAVLRLDDATLRRDALRRLADLRAERALPAALAALGDPDRRVRRAALGAVRSVPGPGAIAPILSALRGVEDGALASRLFAVLGDLGVPETAAPARQALERPEALLHPEALAGARPTVHVTAARILGRFGRKPAVPPLIALLEDPDADVRRAAHEALQDVTNQRVPARGLASSQPRRRAQVVSRWRAFWAANGDERWVQWMRLGFEARGVRFRGRMVSAAGVETLIAALDHRDERLAHNACKVLSEVTGHYVDPTWRSQRNTKRHWRSWWRANRDRVRFD